MSEPPDRLQDWPEHHAAPEFADRVMARISSSSRRERSRRAIVVAFAVGASVSGLAVWMLAARGSAARSAVGRAPSTMKGAAEGHLIATARTHAELGDAAVAVAEPGAELHWQTRAQLDEEQPRGRVFYRADHPLSVRTPVGAIAVTGTSFVIDSESGRTDVVVYEGTVKVSTGHPPVEVVAGHRVRMTARGVGPIRPTAWHDDEPPPSTGAAAVAARSQACACTDDENIFDPSPATLAAWAAECRLRFDVAPNGYDDSGLEHYLDQLALSATERPIVRTVIRAIEARADRDLARAYLEATGDASPVEKLGTEWMFSEVMRSADPGEPADIRRRLSRERAGLEAPPDDVGLVTPYESQVRWVMRSGDVLERELAARLGAARSRELRAKNGGWPGLRWNWAGCPLVVPE